MHTVAILCGGEGTRMRASGERLPKPLVEVGGRPILWHVMALYAGQGFRRFVLVLGHGADRIEAFAATLPSAWEVTCLDTGLEPRALYFVSSEEALEGEPLERLAAAGELAGFRHEGFWAGMDTFKDTLFLNELWARGEAPWRALVEV